MAGIVNWELFFTLVCWTATCPVHHCLTVGNNSSLGADIVNGQSSSSGTIYFNNPHLLNDRRIYLKDGTKALPSPKPMTPEMDNLGGINISEESENIADHLRRIVNDELGITRMQASFDSHLFVSAMMDPESQVEEIALKLEAKIKDYLEILNRNQKRIEELYSQHFWMSPVLPCCSLEEEMLKSNEHFGAKVSFEISCDIVPPNMEFISFSPGLNMTTLLEENFKRHPAIKWQYFISTEGLHTEYPAHAFDGSLTCKTGDYSRHQDIYLSTIQQKKKYVVIILDHGNSLSNKQLEIGKNVAKHALMLLSPWDKIALMGLASEPQYPRNDDCLTCSMVLATQEAKFYFTRFVDGLMKSREATNHTIGIMKAFQTIYTILENEEDASDIVPMIIYISRGLLNSLTEAKTVLSSIAEENEKLNFRVVLNTFAVIDDHKPIMYEKGFLSDIAKQNFKKYHIPVADVKAIKKGMMIPINTTRSLDIFIREVFTSLNLPSQTGVTFSLPHWDSVGKGTVISISRTCFSQGQGIGIVGLDLHLADIAEDIMYFSIPNKMYAFIIDNEGNTIMHPFFSRPSFVSEQSMNTDITYLEDQIDFQSIRNDILRTPSGQRTLARDHIDDSSHPFDFEYWRRTYTWKRVPNTPYIVCVVTQQETSHDVQNLKPSSLPLHTEVAYHRLDLAPTSKMCQHLKQLATIDVSGLYLSPSSFQSPFQYLLQEESKRNVQSYMAYLSDGTKLIANPGLKNFVRNDVAIIVSITSEWKKQFHQSILSKYIIRRYIATPTGTFLLHPGTVIDRFFDPTKRNWFVRALEYPGRIVITAPYLDVGGAGYIVTMSHTIYKGKQGSFHSTFDPVVAVMGVDFTLGYFYKLLLEMMPSCGNDRIVCFLLDDKGYLIAHPGLIEPNGKGPVEQQHITHKEPLVANDILNHKGFVTKKVCNSFGDRTIQRFYQFNTSLHKVMTNYVHGEHCSKYQITLVPGTNVFLGIVNQTCDLVTAFCPCSMVDRLCLNCHRMEQNECECPCECPLEMNLCSGQPLKDEDINPSCSYFPEEIRILDVDLTQAGSLEPCYDPKCSLRKLKSECFGVIDCEWCQLDNDGATPFKTPFCTQQRKCFGGILGARTPYADEIIEGLPLEEYLTVKSTPVGPVAGGIMGCFLVLVLGIYCYRNRIQRSSQQYTSTPGSNIQMSHLNNELDEIEALEYLPAGHSNVLATFENQVNVSPYQMNTNYRRPPGGDSDHGYSTMTPHDDSEYTSSYMEPLVLGKERFRPAASVSAMGSSRASSPVPLSPPLLPVSGLAPPLETGLVLDMSQTTLPELRHGHHILAPVQVHMVDTQ